MIKNDSIIYLIQIGVVFTLLYHTIYFSTAPVLYHMLINY